MDNSSDDRTTFKSLGLSPEVLSILEELGYEEPTPIEISLEALHGGFAQAQRDQNRFREDVADLLSPPM